MKIPLNQSASPQRPPLELSKIRLYSTGAKGKVFTNHFYKSMNHNFGVEMEIRNNTSSSQLVKVAGRIYDSDGNAIARWSGHQFNINANSLHTHDFWVYESTFSSMKEGKYKIQFWVNGAKVQKEFFTVSYK